MLSRDPWKDCALVTGLNYCSGEECFKFAKKAFSVSLKLIKLNFKLHKGLPGQKNLFFKDYNISQILHNMKVQCPASNKKWVCKQKGENMVHSQDYGSK